MNSGRGAWLRFAALTAILVAAIALVHVGGGLQALSYPRIQALLADLGPWGPLAYILTYALLTVVTVPGTLLTVLGATLFPLGWAYLFVLAGATLGASASFALGRALGRDAVERFLSRAQEGSLAERLRTWTERVERNGLFAIAYLRLAYVPFPVLNYAAPLTGVRFRDFALGTLIGIVPGAFVFVFMGNTLRAAWESGSLAGIDPAQAALAAALFAASLLAPLALQRRLGEKGREE